MLEIPAEKAAAITWTIGDNINRITHDKDILNKNWNKLDCGFFVGNYSLLWGNLYHFTSRSYLIYQINSTEMIVAWKPCYFQGPKRPWEWYYVECEKVFSTNLGRKILTGKYNCYNMYVYTFKNKRKSHKNIKAIFGLNTNVFGIVNNKLLKFNNYLKQEFNEFKLPNNCSFKDVFLNEKEICVVMTNGFILLNHQCQSIANFEFNMTDYIGGRFSLDGLTLELHFQNCIRKFDLGEDNTPKFSWR